MRLLLVALVCVVLPGVLCVPRSKRVLQKRGIYGLHGIGLPYGGAYSYGIPASYPLSPYGYGKSLYSKFPTLLNNPHHPEVNYALTHGDASVTSFNVNYPRYPFIHAKPLHPVIAPQLPIASPSFILPEKPIIPVAVSSGVSHQHHFIPQFLPSGLVPAVAAPPPPPPQPINPFYQYAVQPQFVSVQFPIAENPTAAPTLPPTTTTVVVPTQQSTPEPTFIPIAVAGTNFNTDIKPDEQPWRPIINEVTPTSATSVNRPSISLLPPYGLPSTPSTPFITGNENPQSTFFTGSTLPAPIDVNQNTFRPTDFSFNQNTNPASEYPQQRPEYLPPQRPDFQRPGIQGQGSFNQVGGVVPANDNNYDQDNDNGNFGFNQNQNPGFNPAQEYPQQRPEYLPPTNPGLQGQGSFNQGSGVSPANGNNFNQHTGNGNFIPNFNNNHNNNNNNGNDQGYNGPRYLAPAPQTTGLANLSVGQNLGGHGGGVAGRNNGHHKKQRKHSNRNKKSNNGGLTIRVRQGSRDLY